MKDILDSNKSEWTNEKISSYEKWKENTKNGIIDLIEDDDYEEFENRFLTPSCCLSISVIKLKIFFTPNDFRKLSSAEAFFGRVHGHSPARNIPDWFDKSDRGALLR